MLGTAAELVTQRTDEPDARADAAWGLGRLARFSAHRGDGLELHRRRFEKFRCQLCKLFAEGGGELHARLVTDAVDHQQADGRIKVFLGIAPQPLVLPLGNCAAAPHHLQ